MDSEDTLNQRADREAVAITRSRIRGLWISLAVWSFILLNALRVASFLTAHWIPWPIYALGLVANAIVIVGTAILLRNSYKEMRSKPRSRTTV